MKKFKYLILLTFLVLSGCNLEVEKIDGEGIGNADSPPITVSIQGDNSQISPGDNLQLISTINNPFDSALTYTWEIIEGSGVTLDSGSETTLVKIPTTFSSGNVTVKLTVTDGEREAFDEFSFNVLPAPSLTVSILGDSSQIKSGDVIELTSVVNNPFDSVITYDWQIVEGDEVTLVNGSETTLVEIPAEYLAGNVTIRLTVTDGEHEAFDEFTFSVERNLPPTPVITETARNNVENGERISFTGENSTDPENDPLTYFWQIKNGNDVLFESESEAINFDFERACYSSQYTIMLTASDSINTPVSTTKIEQLIGYVENETASINIVSISPNPVSFNGLDLVSKNEEGVKVGISKEVTITIEASSDKCMEEYRVGSYLSDFYLRYFKSSNTKNPQILGNRKTFFIDVQPYHHIHERNLPIDIQIVTEGNKTVELASDEFVVNLNDPLNFLADENFKQCIRNTYFDEDIIDDVTQIDCQNWNIALLDGIECFVNLQFIDFTFNQISSIEPFNSFDAFTKTNIYSIALGDNALSNIVPLEDFVNLDFLSIRNNSVSNILPIQNLNNLRLLSVRNNVISNLTPIQNLFGLEYLYIGGNNFCELSTLNNLNRLEVLSANNMNLWNCFGYGESSQALYNYPSFIEIFEPISNLTSLTDLQLEGNYIYDISFLNNLNNLETLNLDSNEVHLINPLFNMPFLGNLSLQDNSSIACYDLESLNQKITSWAEYIPPNNCKLLSVIEPDVAGVLRVNVEWGDSDDDDVDSNIFVQATDPCDNIMTTDYIECVSRDGRIDFQLDDFIICNFEGDGENDCSWSVNYTWEPQEQNGDPIIWVGPLGEVPHYEIKLTPDTSPANYNDYRVRVYLDNKLIYATQAAFLNPQDNHVIELYPDDSYSGIASIEDSKGLWSPIIEY